MKLLFKERFFSWFDSYDIYDEEGNTVYTVEGKIAWGHKFVIYDRQGSEVGCVRQEILTLLPRFCIYEDDRLTGTLSKELSLFTPRYNLDCNGWHIEGNFMEWDYDIVNPNGAQVAHISKELFHLTDHYVIDVANPEDRLDALMVVLAIDAEKCSRNS